MPEIIQCPTCRRELQIPEEFIGKPVKCPSCGSNFTTSASATAAATPLPRLSDEAVVTSPLPPAYSPPPPPPGPNRARRVLIAPAVLLLLLAPMWMILDCFQIHHALTFQFEDAAEALSLFPPGPFRDGMEKQLRHETEPEVVRRTVIINAIFAFTSLIVTIGAVQMLRLRTWPLALAGAIFALLRYDHCCCIPFNMGAAIYAIVVLFVPWVRSAFQ